MPAPPETDEQLQYLAKKAAELQQMKFDMEPAPNTAIVELATIVGDLIDIVHAHLFRNDDPAQP